LKKPQKEIQEDIEDKRISQPQKEIKGDSITINKRLDHFIFTSQHISSHQVHKSQLQLQLQFPVTVAIAVPVTVAVAVASCANLRCAILSRVHYL
jgi:hypothetical protein